VPQELAFELRLYPLITVTYASKHLFIDFEALSQQHHTTLQAGK
jgi:hypothetical protein